MRDLKFRLLKASEIECRVARVTDGGVQVLLYKDARCDMNILDEVVGPANWTRHHEEIDGNLYCTVSINTADDDHEPIWISKQDVGTESNMEPEKGQASDSFKRACFNWGIGRELYSTPYIWIPAKRCRIENGKNGKKVCKDDFHVGEIEYKDRKITFLTITKNAESKPIWSMGNPENSESAADVFVTEPMIKSLRDELHRVGKSEEGLLKYLDAPSIDKVTIDMYEKAMNMLGAH